MHSASSALIVTHSWVTCLWSSSNFRHVLFDPGGGDKLLVLNFHLVFVSIRLTLSFSFTSLFLLAACQNSSRTLHGHRSALGCAADIFRQDCKERTAAGD